MVGPNTVNKMLGKRSRGNVSRRMLGDKDGDGVPNVFDCQPNNPKKQGLVDDIKERFRRKTPEEKEVIAKQRVIDRNVDNIRREQVRQRSRNIAQEEALKSVEFREREKGERQRKFIKGGGVPGAIRRGIQSTGRGVQSTDSSGFKAADKFTANRKPQSLQSAVEGKGKKRGKKGKKKGKRRKGQASGPGTLGDAFQGFEKLVS